MAITKKKSPVITEQRIAYVLPRMEKESWLDAALRMGKGKNLQEEIKHSYDKYINLNYIEEKAAWSACYDWGVLEMFDLDKQL